ncbi:hypothetical protein QR680_005862 [Steinernema hermaphroditum]|uniref:Uncharacterized protein n=1 Tax=Steinernema hermaphroditum TaxID=289476 RepID=A0AA39HUP0_9BILA|nr:hypothetical protein QR680_005862 [Steinernema hermaphroditum]
MNATKNNINEELELLNMCWRLSVVTVSKLKSQLAVTEKNISEQLTNNSYSKRKEEQAKLVTEMRSAAGHVLKMHNDITEKILEFSNHLHDHCERVMDYKNEVNELLQKAQEFETTRDQNIIPDYVKEDAQEPTENNVDDITRLNIPEETSAPNPKLAEAEAAYEEVKKMNALNEKRNEIQQQEVMADYEKFYEQFKSSLRTK